MTQITWFFFTTGSFNLIEHGESGTTIEAIFPPTIDAFTEVDKRYVLPENLREAIRDMLTRRETRWEVITVGRR